MKQYDYLSVGAGLYGVVMAYKLEKRKKMSGNRPSETHRCKCLI